MARCGGPRISVRAKEPDEVGPETERDFAYFDPSKSVAEGRKGHLSLASIQLTSQNRCVTQSVTKCITTRSVGTIMMHFRQLYRPLREQARSHGLRPASKAELCITMSAGTRVINQVSSIYQR
ncbi:hypothetical protein CFN58_08480 [Pseudomonas avellanae]|uniref:Uncharacterized protein n=1 Tax=Pseudomonas avellanae TaxID=46257 RepID=A0A261WKU7_9PSED|nr:hypothetical protein CFN58_08480 [Pseudomonas avellanae]